MKKYDELSNKEKHNFEEFLILTFEFSDDELAEYSCAGVPLFRRNGYR